jgi:plastocyanin
MPKGKLTELEKVGVVKAIGKGTVLASLLGASTVLQAWSPGAKSGVQDIHPIKLQMTPEDIDHLFGRHQSKLGQLIVVADAIVRSLDHVHNDGNLYGLNFRWTRPLLLMRADYVRGDSDLNRTDGWYKDATYHGSHLYRKEPGIRQESFGIVGTGARSDFATVGVRQVLGNSVTCNLNFGFGRATADVESKRGMVFRDGLLYSRLSNTMIRTAKSYGPSMMALAVAGPCWGSEIFGHLLLANGKPTQNGAVWISGSTKDSPMKGAMVDQHDFTFIPHASIVTVGSRDRFTSNDTVYHNLFAEYNAKKFDLGMYPQGTEKGVTFDGVGLVVLRCSIHSKMSAYVMVVDSPFFAVADKNGHFRISNLTPGTRRLHDWHECGQTAEQALTGTETAQRLDISIARQ